MIFTKWLEAFGKFVLRPFENNGRLRLIIVMVIIPLIMNALQVSVKLYFK